jgi:hypothetical protein
LPYSLIKHEFRRGFVLSARSRKRVSNPGKGWSAGCPAKATTCGKRPRPSMNSFGGQTSAGTDPSGDRPLWGQTRRGQTS